MESQKECQKLGLKHFYNTSQHSRTHLHTHSHTNSKVVSLQRVGLLIRNSHKHSHTNGAIRSHFVVKYLPKDTSTCRPEEPGIEPSTS